MTIVQEMRRTMMENLGIYESGLGKKSNETSGIAIQRRQETGHSGTVDFIDNLAYSISSVGDILCNIIPKMYRNDVIRRIILPDDTQAEVRLNHTIEDKESGMKFKIGNLSLARYTCSAQVGPHTITQQQKFIETMTEWGRADPEMLQMSRDILVKHIHMPFARELEERVKRTIPHHLLSPEDQARYPEPPPPPPTPEQEVEMQVAKATMAKAESDQAIAQLNMQAKEFEFQQEQERTNQEREKTQQQELRTQAENARLEATVEKGANELANAGGQQAPSEEKLLDMVKREVAKAFAEAR